MKHIEAPLICKDWQGNYALLDCGHGRKLERYGKFIVNRPDPQALWTPAAPITSWRADAEFSTKSEEQERGAWDLSTPIPETWPMRWEDIAFRAKLSPFRHMGVFPEHSVHWRFAYDAIKQNGGGRILNLFGYTGLASLACAAAGAEVTHCDASPQSVGNGKENQSLSRLDNASIRWIVDDAMKFLAREIRRGRRYDGIILDPPKFGRGPKNERWQFAEMFPDLMEGVRAALSDQPLFVIVTSYAVRLSYVSLAQTVADYMDGLGGTLQSGEMFIAQDDSNRLLPMALYTRWSADAL